LRANLIKLGIRIETIIEFEEDQFLEQINIIDEIQNLQKLLKGYY